MQHAQALPSVSVSAIPHGASIPALARSEAMEMAAEELRRFVALIETLGADDWNQPTACTLWTVKDVVAHQAAHITGFTSLGSFTGQLSPALLRPYRERGMNQLDATNQAQVDLRRDYSPEQLIAEIRDNAERSLRGRSRIPGVLRAPKLPLPGLDQPRSLGYLFDVIYTRDMWMHRHDICSATGRTMPLDAGHDARTVALIVRDLAEKSRTGLGGRAAVLRLNGPAGGEFGLGASSPAEATVEMDTLTFCVLTSGRSRAEAVLADEPIVFQGNPDFGREVVRYFENSVLY